LLFGRRTEKKILSMPILYSNVTTEPTVEPVVIGEAKLHLRVDHSDEDTLIAILIQAAREWVEKRTGRSLINQTRTAKMDFFPRTNTIRLPYGKVSSLTSIYYYNDSEVSTLLAASEYWTDFTNDISRIIVKNSWPSTYDMPNAVTLVYVAGYGSAASNVPRPLKQAMFLIIGHLYEHREQVGEIMHEVPFGVEALVGPYVLEQSVIYT